MRHLRGNGLIHSQPRVPCSFRMPSWIGLSWATEASASERIPPFSTAGRRIPPLLVATSWKQSIQTPPQSWPNSRVARPAYQNRPPRASGPAFGLPTGWPRRTDLGSHERVDGPQHILERSALMHEYLGVTTAPSGHASFSTVLISVDRGAIARAFLLGGLSCSQNIHGPLKR